MAEQSYQKVRYRLIQEEAKLFKLLDELLQVVRDDEGISARYTFADIDQFYVNVEHKFKKLMDYVEAYNSAKHTIVLEMRVEVINDVCKGNSFKGFKFNERVNNILALRLILKSMQQYSVKSIFLAIVDPNTPMTELFTTFGIRRRTASVNWEESEPHEEAYEQRRRHRPFRDFFGGARRAYANSNEDFRRHASGTSPDPEPVKVVLSSEGWPLNEVWAYKGEASLLGITYEKVLNIESSVTADQLKTAYHRAIKKSHQDATGSTDQAENARQVTAAYRVAKKVLGYS